MIRLKEVQNSMTQETQDHRTSLAFLVYNLVAMFIAWSSWKSSLAAYGICTCDILFLLLQFLHSNVFFFSFLKGTSVFSSSVVMITRIDGRRQERHDLRNRSHQTANITYVHSERIADIEQPLLQEAACTMCNHAIAFHLAKTQTTISSSTFNRLPRQDLSRSSRSRMNFVIDHVP